MSEDELKTLIREFKESVSGDLADQHRRLDEIADEVRIKIDEVRTSVSTAETAIINEIRALSNRFDRRLERIERGSGQG